MQMNRSNLARYGALDFRRLGGEVGGVGGAHLPQGRKGHGGIIVQLIGADVAHDPPPPPEGQGQQALHLLVPRIHQGQARNQVRPAEGQ